MRLLPRGPVAILSVAALPPSFPPGSVLPQGREDIDGMSMTPAATGPAAEEGGSAHWRRNLVVCIFGSFTTIVAMTLLLPFLPLYVEQLGVSYQPA